MQYSAAISQQAGVSLDELASYVTVISSVMRVSAETVGQSLKTMFTRFEQVKVGQLFEDDPTTINQVAESLHAVGIELMKDADTFRPLGDVLDELSKKWDTLTVKQQNAIAGTIAGVRQVPQFLTLMENYGDVLVAQGIAADSTGLAMDRYSIYLENVEASSNKLKATWEGMWSDAIDPKAIIGFNNLLIGVMDLIDAFGGLIPVITAVGVALLIMNGPQVALAFRGLLADIGKSITALISMGTTATATGTAVNAAFGIVGIVVGAAILAFNYFNETTEETQQRLEGLRGEVDSLQGSLVRLNKEMTSLGDLGKKFEELKNKTELTNDEQKEFYKLQEDIKSILPDVSGYYDDQGRFILDASVNLQKLIDLKKEEIEIEQKKLDLKTEETLKAEIEAYKKQSESVKRLVDAYNAAQGDMVLDSGVTISGSSIIDIPQLEKDIETAKILNEEYVNHIKQTYYSGNEETKRMALEMLRSFGGAAADLADELETRIPDYATTFLRFFDAKKMGSDVKKVEDAYKSLVDTLSALQTEMKSISELSDKAMMGEISYDDVNKLLEMDEKYIELLTVENGKIKLNTDELRKAAIAKAEKARVDAEAGGASKAELDVLDAYVSQLKRAIPLSREFITTYQNLIDQTGSLMGGEAMSEPFRKLGTSIMEVSEQFRQGKITAKEYFEALNSQTENLNMKEVFGENQAAAQTFFSGTVANAMQSLTQISSMFDAGEMTITGYTEALMELTGVFENIGSMVEDFGSYMGMTAESISSVTSYINGMSSGVADLTNMQELNTLVQQTMYEVTTNGLKANTEDYNNYAISIANAAVEAGYVYEDINGNIYKTSGEIASFLQQDLGNFMNFANGTGQSTGKILEGVVHNIGGMLVEVGKAINNFKGKISITPTVREFKNFPSVLAGLVTGNAFELPVIDLEVGNNLGDAIIAGGNALKGMTFNFDSNVYKEPMDQITDSIGGVGGAYDDLGESIKDANDAATEGAKEQKKALDELEKKIKRVIDIKKKQLKEELDAYKKLIDTRKEALDWEEKLRDFQEEVDEKEKDIATLKNEILELSLDSSEEAVARRLKLEEELQKKLRDLEETQREQSIEEQKKALDEEYENYKDLIEKKIKDLEDLLDKMDSITAESIAELLEKLEELGITVNVETGETTTHHSGLASGPVGNKATGINERFAKLMDGEVVLNNHDMKEYMNKTLPSMLNNPVYSSVGGGFSIEKFMELNIAGNLDNKVLPDIENIVDRAIEKLNEIMRKNGITRNVTQYGS